VLSGLKHPNIIRLLEAHFLGGVFYFVMEFAEGGPLVKHIYARWAVGVWVQGSAHGLPGRLDGCLDIPSAALRASPARDPRR
jgi:serine/threonine protein kinase